MIQYCLKLGAIHTNCYVIADEKSGKSAVIDPGEFNSGLISLMHCPGISTVESILITHGHFDHILGAKKLKDYTGANVFIHRNDAGCLEDEKLSMAFHAGKGVQDYITPDFILDDKTLIELGEIRIKTLHTPGHTPGSVCFICENQKILFSGDFVFRYDIGRTDFPGGNMNDMLKSLKKILMLDADYKIYPGHGEPTILSEERLENKYMRMLR